MAMTRSFRAVAFLALVHLSVGQFPCGTGYTDKSGSPTCLGAMDSTCSTFSCCDAVQTPAPTPAPTPPPTPAPTTCATYSAAWILAAALGGGCATETKFFDLQKMNEQVASPEADADIIAACCTPFADATCSDWTLMACSTIGQANLGGTTAAAADTTNGMGIEQATFDSTCCSTVTPSPTPAPTYTCASFSAAWILAQGLGNGCAEDTMFFDTKKMTQEVASNTDADIKAACCTPFANALCSDWVIFCNSGTYVYGPDSAPGGGDDGMTLTQSEFQSACCREPLACSEYGTEAGSALRTAVPMVAVMGALAAMIMF